MRKRIYQIIEAGSGGDGVSRAYDVFMVIVIMASLVPLLVKQEGPVMLWLDRGCVTIFIVDYVLRLATADYKLRRGPLSFLIYPFTFLAIIDLLSILPTILTLNRAFRLLKGARLVRCIKAVRVFKTFRYSKNIALIARVMRRQRSSLVTVAMLVTGYIFQCALVMFCVEPETFDTFFDALYWAAISITTVGYGDIYAVSTIGKVITMISSLVAIAVIALPAGIITAGFMEELNEQRERERNDE